MADVTRLFSHRRNKDGSFESICRICFSTVARSKQEAELAEQDSTHICDSSFLAERGCLRSYSRSFQY